MPVSKDPKNSSFSRRPPAALFLWLLVFLVGASLFIFNSSSFGKKPVEWSADEFRKNLYDGLIDTAFVTPESDKILSIEGEYRLPQSGTTEVKDLSGNESKLRYTTRIYATDELASELQDMNKALASGRSNVNPDLKVVYLQRDTWWEGILFNLIIGIVIIALIYFLFARQMRGGGGALQFGKSRARMVLPNEHNVKFDDVAGCDEAKEETREIVEYLKDPLKFKLLGGKIPHGALLTGPPGTGKTLMAKAVSGEASVPFFAISGSDFVEMFVGVGASRVRDMFEQARKHAPCLIFIDEIDAVGRSRFTGIGGGHDEREQTLNAMLVEMDGLETQEGVIVLAATNRPDVLDPALLRPGRFDRQIVIDLPDIAGRRKILDVHAKRIKLDPKADLDVIAKSTPGFSGADLANLINEAALLAARENRTAAVQSDLEEARDKVCFGRERRSRKIPERDRRLTAWHEAGHAIVNLFLEHSIPLHKVTIIPRGQALGLTMMMDHEDRYSRSRLEMLDSITTDLGGRVAEELALGDITSGASQDIAHATNLAHSMVCSFGMSEKMGTVQYGQRQEHIYLGRDITRNESCSEETLREIDSEVKRIIVECKQRATDILTRERARLDKLANALLEKETLSAQEIRALLDLPEPEDDQKPETQKGEDAAPDDSCRAVLRGEDKSETPSDDVARNAEAVLRKTNDDESNEVNSASERPVSPDDGASKPKE